MQNKPYCTLIKLNKSFESDIIGLFFSALFCCHNLYSHTGNGVQHNMSFAPFSVRILFFGFIASHSNLDKFGPVQAFVLLFFPLLVTTVYTSCIHSYIKMVCGFLSVESMEVFFFVFFRLKSVPLPSPTPQPTPRSMSKPIVHLLPRIDFL